MKDIFQRNTDMFNSETDAEHLRRAEIVCDQVSRLLRTTDPKPHRLLSIICSIGLIEEKIRDLGVEVRGIDGSTYSLRKVQERGIAMKRSDVFSHYSFC